MKQLEQELPAAAGKLNRRHAMLGLAAGLAAVGTGGYAYISRRPFEGEEISPIQAHQMATAGDILLIDIRRPDEWEKTGIGEGAEPLDMRRDDFVERLTALAKGDTSLPIAVICARGVRSSQLSQRLSDAGFTRIIDIPEGMLGSRAGPGWVERGLPVRQPS